MKVYRARMDGEPIHSMIVIRGKKRIEQYWSDPSTLSHIAWPLNRRQAAQTIQHWRKHGLHVTRETEA